MAEMDTSQGGGKKKGHGKGKTKKASTRVDLTPMVDLGFLLVTFFMLTTTFSKPQTMEVNMPVKDENEKEQTKVRESNAFTMILGANNKVYYYSGSTGSISTTNYSPNGIRKVLAEKVALDPKLSVMIKPTKESNYRNMVESLDEMNITGVKFYAIVDPSPEDLKRIVTEGK